MGGLRNDWRPRSRCIHTQRPRIPFWIALHNVQAREHFLGFVLAVPQAVVRVVEKKPEVLMDYRHHDLRACMD
jgi:hypothetical protein